MLRVGSLPLAALWIWAVLSEPIDFVAVVGIFFVAALPAIAWRSRIVVRDGALERRTPLRTTRQPLTSIVGLEVGQVALPFGGLTAGFLTGVDHGRLLELIADARTAANDVGVAGTEDDAHSASGSDETDPTSPWADDDEEEEVDPELAEASFREISFSPIAWTAWRDVVALFDHAAAANGVPLTRRTDADLSRILRRPSRPEAELFDPPQGWFARQRGATTAPSAPRWALVGAWVVVVAVLFWPVSAASAEPAYPLLFELLVWVVLIGIVGAPIALGLGWPHAVRASWLAAATGVVVGVTDFAFDADVAAAETALFLGLCAVHSAAWARLSPEERARA